MNITAQDIINSLFNPDDIVNIRIFDDRKDGIFAGKKYSVEAGKFIGLESILREHNAKNRGVFFVVNSGGHNDRDINRINAQFVEMDDKTFAEQQKLIDEFPLPPSMIIKTKKSLHTYWFMKNAAVNRFRAVQRGLIEHFGGDPVCINESRVMRLPGYYHCKGEPVMVECILFHPERKYTQSELSKYLNVGNTDNEVKKSEYSAPKKGNEKGLELVLSQCDFLKHCKEDAETLSEHDWYAMITNLFPFDKGIEKIHEFSQAYPRYSKQETDSKIAHFQNSGTRPITCKTIAEKGFKCPKHVSGECTCKAPAALCYEEVTMETLQALIDNMQVSTSAIENLQRVRKFTKDFLFNVDAVTANAVIGHLLKQKFNLKNADIKPLLSFHKEVYKQFESNRKAKDRSKNSENIPDWYEMSERGLRFLPDILAADMAKKAPVFYAAEQYYAYKHGVYNVITELDAKNMIREKMLPGYTKLSQITDAEGQWKMQIQRDVRELDSNPYIINVKNGLYNVLEDRLTQHDERYLSTVQLNVNYTPGADCPRFRQFLHESLSDDQVVLIQEMLGYFLIPVNRAQKSFVIVGEAGAGKSKLLLVLNDILLGKENVSNVSWQSLNERFKTAELFGKLANIFADLPTKNIDDNGIFKALVGEDYLTVERKNKNPFSFQPYARLLFSCNKIPRNYGDKSEGFYRRLIIVRFSHAVPEEKRDPDLMEKFRAEADGILIFALEGLRRLMENHYKFSETEVNREELQKYREDSNSVLAFIKECCEIEPNSHVSRAELFNHYKTYCEESGLVPFAQRNFNMELENNYPEVQRAKDALSRRTIWKGIKIVDSQD